MKGSGEQNQVFEYNPANNFSRQYLLSVSLPKTGKKTTFKYGIWNMSYWVVISDTITGGILGIPNSIDIYTYSDSCFIDDIHKIQYKRHTTRNSGTGNIVSTFDINADGNAFGVLKQVDTYNKAGTRIIASQTTSYYTINLPNWSICVPADKVNTLDGIVIKSGSPWYCGINDLNNQPFFTYDVNSDGTALAAKRTFAYEQYGGIFTANMLTQVAEIKTYKLPNYDLSCISPSAPAYTANFTTWSNITGVWRPKANYIWNVNMDANGNPMTTFVDFDTLNPTGNNWQLTGTFDRYDNDGHLLQSSNALGVSNCSIYGTQAALPIGLHRQRHVLRVRGLYLRLQFKRDWLAL
jgi:hypothetical protein